MPNKELGNHYMIVFFHNLIRHFTFFLFPLFFLEIGLNGFQTGLLMAIFTVVGLLFSFHVGVKCDQVHQRKLLMAGIALFILFCIGLLYTVNIWILIILFVMGGLGHLVIKRATETFIYKATDHKKKGKEMAMLTVIYDSPFIFGVLLGGYLIHNFGFNLVFKLSALFTLCLLFIVLRIKKNKVCKFAVEDYLKELKDKKVLYFCIVIFIFALHFGAEQVAYSLFLKENLGLSIVGLSYFMAAVMVPLVISAIVCGIMIDRKFNKQKLLYYSMLLSGIGGFMFAATSNTVVSILWRALHEIGDGAFMVMISIGIISLFNKKKVGGHAGFVNVVIILAVVVGSLIFGPIGYRFGYHLPHMISGALSITAFFMILILNKFKKN